MNFHYAGFCILVSQLPYPYYIRMFLITCITGRDKKIVKVRTRSEWFDRAAVGRHVVAWSTKCGLKRGLAIFFIIIFFYFCGAIYIIL